MFINRNGSNPIPSTGIRPVPSTGSDIRKSTSDISSYNIEQVNWKINIFLELEIFTYKETCLFCLKKYFFVFINNEKTKTVMKRPVEYIFFKHLNVSLDTKCLRRSK